MSVSIVFNKGPLPKKQSSNLLSLNYGGQKIVFEHSERSSNVNRVLIKVLPDCRVTVQAPAGTKQSELLSAVKKRARWIHIQLRKFSEQSSHVTPRKYISGESHYYLGKQYVLKVIESKTEKPHIKLLRGKIEAVVKHKTPQKVQDILNEWYKEKAKEVFAKRLDALLDQALWVDKHPPVRVLSMKTQWGSCSPTGRLTLNPQLIKAPRECIDYVILHELCHIAEHNHSTRFYRLMKQVMPNWENIKQKLDNMASIILISTAE